MTYRLRLLLSAFLAAGLLYSTANAQFDTAAAWGDADPTGMNGTQGGDPDTGTDVVNGRMSGEFTSDGTTTTITAGGFDFWSPDDGAVFVYDSGGAHTTTGDFTAAVRHVDVNNNFANEWGRTVLDARVSQTPGTPTFNDAHVMVMRQSNGTGRTGWRDTAGGDTGRDDGAFPAVALGNVGPTGSGNPAAYMSLGRSGNVITTGFAMDIGGTAGRWVQHGSREQAAWAAGNEVIVGLGHQAHNQDPNHPASTEGTGGAGRVNTATFDNWSYGDSYNAAFFGAPAGQGEIPWNLGGSLAVDSNSGAVNGSAYVTEAGAATGEVVKWTVTAQQLGALQSGLNADIYLAGNPGNQGGARGIIAGAPAGTAIINNVDWTGGGDDDANYNGLTGPESFGVAVQGVDPADNAAGAFSGNQDNYGVHMTGEIFIPDDAARGGVEEVKFKDGIDDYTFLGIDGGTLIDDNAWTGYNGSDNNGSPIVSLDVSDAKYDDGEWVSFEMIMWEGGGGDNGVLYWDVANTDFPAANADPAGVGAIVPADNFRHNEKIGDPVMAMGTTQVGSDTENGSFGLDLGPGDWEVTLSVVNTGASTSITSRANVVPEPSSFGLLALSGLALLGCRRRRT